MGRTTRQRERPEGYKGLRIDPDVPVLENSPSYLDIWNKSLKEDAGKYRSKTKYRDEYEPTLKYER